MPKKTSIEQNFLTPTKPYNKLDISFDHASNHASSTGHEKKNILHELRNNDNKSCFSGRADSKEREKLDIVEPASIQRTKTAEAPSKETVKAKDNSDSHTIKS